jgi:hypothetical protein
MPEKDIMQIGFSALRQFICTCAVLLYCFLASAQILTDKKNYTSQDSLRGSNGPGRAKWDVIHYDITVKPDYENKTIAGKNIIRYIDSGINIIQVDLQQPMVLDSVSDGLNQFPFRREGNVYWVQVRDSSARYKIKIGERKLITWFHGKPREAVNPPWDGGWIWTRDDQNNPWFTVACQGLGASVWYPCKDAQWDEPDSGAILRIIVPDSLTAVGNGRLTEKRLTGNGNTIYTWEVKNPINNYNIVPYIGKYVHFSETYPGLNGKLDMDYWVMDYNLEKAKTQFKDAPKMLKAFEHWFGPYPFYQDGYKLVEAPYPGMEHQSAIAYGNEYKMGYKGTNTWSHTPWSYKWDFIIVHESGHEWFGNNITSKDLADMWIHESFTCYGEVLFTEYFFGKKAGSAYAVGTRDHIDNIYPVIRNYGVNEGTDIDGYYKGLNMLHTIRQVINDDKKFRSILIGLNKEFYHTTVSTKNIEDFINRKSGIDFSKLFDQYLRTTKIPVLEYKITDQAVFYRWTNVVNGFNLSLKVSPGQGLAEKWIYPTMEWKKINAVNKKGNITFSVNENFYIETKEVD